MGKAVILALVASMFTATSTLCQRRGAALAPGGNTLSPRLLLYLVRQPVWLLGIASMILGFAFQVSALHFGSLALVQPILASELLFVFAFLAVSGLRRVRPVDWAAGAAMAAGLGVFLLAAAPANGRRDAPAWTWWAAGLVTLGLALLATLMAFFPRLRQADLSPGRRAASLGVATGISWGFVAAVIKELSTPRRSGFVALLSSWPLYVLIVAGAASLLLSSHALQAGPVAASQPGFTLVDPLVASLLGVFIFHDHLHFHSLDIVVEVAAVAIAIAGVVALSRSPLVVDEVRAAGKA